MQTITLTCVPNAELQKLHHARLSSIFFLLACLFSLPTTTSTPLQQGSEPWSANPSTMMDIWTHVTLSLPTVPCYFLCNQNCQGGIHNYHTGWVQLWGTAEWECQSDVRPSFLAFSAEVHKVFGLVSFQSSATCQLLALWQGQRSVADYVIDFCMLASQSSWNPVAA